eukprot:55759-Eustigmatos_ZCMA.PRE.1
MHGCTCHSMHTKQKGAHAPVTTYGELNSRVHRTQASPHTATDPHTPNRRSCQRMCLHQSTSPTGTTGR